jgi:Ca-activated chloride channel homolog
MPSRAPSLCLLALALALLPTSAVVADEVEEPTRLQLVLDSSGSMNEAAQGGTRLQIAKRALSQVIRGLPPEAETGLRVYGATVDSGPGACTDSQQVVAPDTDNRAELLTAVRDYKALGETPIGYALQEAAKDLGAEGRRTIVLVSDGEPTCDPDPCVVARRLTEQGIDVRIDVIGLDVSADVRRQLACIAAAGNGTYYDADDVPTLTRSLDQLSTRAFRPFQLDGTAVQGTLSEHDAPVIGAGQYLDTMPTRTLRDDVKLHYLVRRTVPGSTIHVGMTLRSPAGGVLTSYLGLRTPAGGYCSDGLGQVINVLGQRSLLGTATSSRRGDVEDPCNNEERLQLTVSHSDEAMAGEKFELVVYEEPPVEQAHLDEPPTPRGSVRWTPQRVERRSPVEPGLSMSDAPTLEPGSYDLQILTGETQVFAVPLAWGERLQAEAVVAPRRGALADAVDSTANMEMRVFDPVRAEVSTLFDIPGTPRASNAFQFFEDAEPYRVGVATPPVAYGNRADLATASSSLPGLRFVEVSFSGGSVEGDAYLLPYQLKVATFDDGDGEAPTYTGDLPAPPVPAPAELAATARVGDAEPPEPTPRLEAEPVHPETTATAAQDGDGPSRLWPTLALALLTGALLTLGAVRRARKRPTR